VGSATASAVLGGGDIGYSGLKGITPKGNTMGLETAAIIGIAGAAGSSAAGIYGAKKQSDAAKRAAQAQTQSNAEALAWEREQDALDRQQYAETEAQNRRRWDIEADREEGRYALTRGDQQRAEARDIDTYNAEQARRQPYRDISLSAAKSLAEKLGLQINVTAAPQLARDAGTAYTPQTMNDLLRTTRSA